MANPTGKGGFPKGQSGNPAGVTKEKKQAQMLFQSLCQDEAQASLELLVKFRDDKKVSKQLRKDCAVYIIERAFGKSVQPTKELEDGETYAEFLKSL